MLRRTKEGQVEETSQWELALADLVEKSNV